MPDDTRDSVRISLLAGALTEANNAVRAYDTKAQIAAVGYIFSLGIAGQILSYIETDFALTSIKVAGTWIIFMVPILQFGLVLYPSRGSLKTSGQGVLFSLGGVDVRPKDFAERVQSCDPITELSSELLRVSSLREIKRKRFTRGMFLTMTAYSALFLFQIIAAS